MTAGSSYVTKMVESVASTNFGQYFIKKIDSLLWTIERPAKYCVNSESKSDGRNLPWPIFWTILINLQIFRVVLSKILVQFNENPIEPKDIVTKIQKWRRTLRSIRFRGLRNIRESRRGNGKANGNGVATGSQEKQLSKKRNYDEMLELDDFMNETFLSDETDPTFMISNCGDVSSNGSSNDGGSLSKNVADYPLQDTLPISASESEQQEPNVSSKSSEMTFVSTLDTEESAFSEEDSINSPNGHKKSESNGTMSTPKIGKESLNQPIDPLDAMMSELVEIDNKKKNHFKKNGKNHQGNKKKRNFSLTTSQENVNRQMPLNKSRSQESINQL